MESSIPVLGQDLSFLQCYICLQNVKKPRMCPSCSKLACQNCLRTWIEESRSQCPHCRKALNLNSFPDCQRFVNDIKHLIHSIDNNEKQKQKCPDHRIDLQYFCQDCVEPICSDCGMFGKHRGHNIIHLTKIYQENKNRILNELAKYDAKIESYRRNANLIRRETQKLLNHITLKKNFIEQYFVSLIERLDDEYREKKEKIESKHDENIQEIQFLESFRDNIVQELEGKSQKELILKSQEFIKYIKDLCQRELEFEEEEYGFDTIHELIPKYQKFSYVLKNYHSQTQSIIYSNSYEHNGLQWRLKIYPKGNGVAKNTHISVFLELTKGYQNQNKYQYKIELINRLCNRESIIRQYSSKFDIGECWGYNQFIPLNELEKGFLEGEDDSLEFNICVRNPSYRSLVRDQEKYIKNIENKLNCIENVPSQSQIGRRQKMNELQQQAQGRKVQIKNFLSENQKSNIFEEIKLQESRIQEEEQQLRMQILSRDHYSESSILDNQEKDESKLI